MHRDCLGQLISIGSRVLWSAHNSYAGFDKGVMEVISISPKKIRIEHGTTGRKSTVDPSAVIVVDVILDQPHTQQIAAGVPAQ